jgi:Protein of unknown function (DUF1501)
MRFPVYHGGWVHRSQDQSRGGRTPRVNATAGRDHWTHCYSVMLAGAGIRGGTVYGTSDSHAAFVRDNPVSPADICATIYACLGIDPDTLVTDRADRPGWAGNPGNPQLAPNRKARNSCYL